MVRVRVPCTPRKQPQKQRKRPVPPTYRLSLEEMQQQPQPWDPTPHLVPRQVVPWSRPPACRRLAERSPTPQLGASSV